MQLAALLTVLLTVLAGLLVSTLAATPSEAASSPEATGTTGSQTTESIGTTGTTLPAYRYSIRKLDADLKARMRYSWHSGCPVPRYKLRYIRMTYYGFDGAAHQGEMVVHRYWARRVVGAFRDVYAARFPIRQMRLVDDFKGSDDASMAANNTSAFNCRKVTGGSSWSQHSYGRALDINPVQNPYVSGSTVEPPAGKAYVDRSPRRKGMVRAAVRDAFTDIGWEWGGYWRSIKDYMHFSSNNR